MAQAKTAANKQKASVRMLDGKVVRPALFNGRAAGMGKYFAGEVEGKLVTDENGVPLKLKEIGQLV